MSITLSREKERVMNVFRSLKLLLPALIPSWNFFDIIAPSPRIQFILLTEEKKTYQEWLDFRPHPSHVSFVKMLKKIFWNPQWNESLFLVSCSERIMQQHTEHSENEILNRIEKDIYNSNSALELEDVTHLQFRLIFIKRQGNTLHKEITFTSRLKSLSAHYTL